MAKPAAIEARKAKAMEDLAAQVAEQGRKLDLILGMLGGNKPAVVEAAPEEPKAEETAVELAAEPEPEAPKPAERSKKK